MVDRRDRRCPHRADVVAGLAVAVEEKRRSAGNRFSID
jgi:hypothetical protein